MDTTARPYPVWCLAFFVVFVMLPLVGRAQTFESVGIRAQGMGGAFVAVADDATASWWNPAGLAHGAYFSALWELGTTRQPNAERDAASRPLAAWRGGARALSVSFPALALSYYRLRISQMQPLGSTAAVPSGRQDDGAIEVRLRSLALNQFGATVGESIGEHLVIASTLKLLRGSAATAVRSGGEASLDRAADLEGAGETHGDLDVGAMAVFGRTRLGLTIKNVTTPAFGAEPDRVELQRQVRAGVAVVTAARRNIGQVVLAFDADMTTTPSVTGDVRHVAAGVEAWVPSRRFGLRGGVRANTIGEARPSAGVGISLALRSGTFLDAQRTLGAEVALQGWGFALRMTF